MFFLYLITMQEIFDANLSDVYWINDPPVWIISDDETVFLQFFTTCILTTYVCYKTDNIFFAGYQQR